MNARLDLPVVDPAFCQRLDCPVRRDARRASALSQDLGLALRRLRSSLRACRRCPAGPDCSLRVDLADQVHRAVLQVVSDMRGD